MHDSNRADPKRSKDIAKKHYAYRQIEKYFKWSIEQRGCIRWKDIVEQQELYGIRPS